VTVGRKRGFFERWRRRRHVRERRVAERVFGRARPATPAGRPATERRAA
jgi:hypothetical protein